MGPLFLKVMQRIAVERPHVHFIIPIARQGLYPVFFKQIQTEYGHLKIQIIQGNAREAMAISDVVLTKSGTATLEAMLLKRPMVVAFKWSKLTHAIIAPQLKVPYIALPNLLAGKKLIPEFVQEKANVDSIAESVMNLLDSSNQSELIKQFTDIHYTLRQNANEKAALAILRILEDSLT